MPNACCGIITMQFHLFVCKISITPPPVSGGGGGGPYPTSPQMLYTPLTNQWRNGTRLVIVTVKINDSKWRVQYILDRTKVDILINVINFVNRMKDRSTILIDNIRLVIKKVMVRFNNKKISDKTNDK